MATRVTLGAVPPATLAFLRLALAALILVPLTWRGGPARLGTADRRRIAWMGVLGFAAAFALAWARRRVEAPRAAVFLCVQPVAGALLGAALLGEAPGAVTLAGGALIVAGLGVALGAGAR